MNGTRKAVISAVARVREWEGVPPRSELHWIRRLLVAAVANEDVVALEYAARGLRALRVQYAGSDAWLPALDIAHPTLRCTVHALEEMQLLALDGIDFWRPPAPAEELLDLPWEMPSVVFQSPTERMRP